MSILVDTNILLRAAEPSSTQHRECVDALQRLTEAKADQVVCAQVLIEFWVAATRPVSVNGLGMGAAEAKATLDDFLRTSRCLTEPPDIAARWRDVVTRYSVLGKQAHDARIVAIMGAHGISRILTLNVGDFSRYPHLDVTTPEQVLLGQYP
jgi:predicted nucleic acid-binding protein